MDGDGDAVGMRTGSPEYRPLHASTPQRSPDDTAPDSQPATGLVVR